METKAFYTSKTVWVNVIAIILSVIAVTDPTLFNLDPKFVLWVTGVLNIALRFLGGAPLSADGAPKSGG
jgi:hypothetical protein